MLSALPTYIALAEGGMLTVGANHASVLMSKGDVTGARRQLHTACAFLALVSLLIVAGAFALASTFRLDPPLFEPQGLPKFGGTIILLVLYTVAGLWLSIPGLIYRAIETNAHGVLLATHLRVVELVVTCVVIQRTHSFFALAASLLSVRLVGLGILTVDSMFKSKQLRIGFAEADMGVFKVNLRPSLWYLAFSIGNGLYLQGITLVVGFIQGPASVVVFTATRALSRAIVQVTAVVKYSIWPELSHLIAKNDLERAKRLVGLALEVTFISGILTTLGIAFFGKAFITGWTTGAIDPPLSFVILLSGVGILNSLWNNLSAPVLSINLHERLAITYIASTSLVVGLAAAFGFRWGLVGIAIAMAVGDLCVIPVVLKQVSQILNSKSKSILVRALMLSESRKALKRMKDK